MGVNESKIKKAFEEIDTSGDKKLDADELANFLRSPRGGEVLSQFSRQDQEEFIVELLIITAMFDGKFTFEQFKIAVLVSVITILKSHNKAGDIQQIFTSK